MKTILTAAILGLTGLAGAVSADAQDVHKYRSGNGHQQARPEPRHDYRPEQRHDNRFEFRHDRRPEFHGRVTVAPRLEWFWVPARYDTVFSGYECGKPVYRTVCVSAGYWSTRVACD